MWTSLAVSRSCQQLGWLQGWSCMSRWLPCVTGWPSLTLPWPVFRGDAQHEAALKQGLDPALGCGQLTEAQQHAHAGSVCSHGLRQASLHRPGGRVHRRLGQFRLPAPHLLSKLPTSSGTSAVAGTRFSRNRLCQGRAAARFSWQGSRRTGPQPGRQHAGQAAGRLSFALRLPCRLCAHGHSSKLCWHTQQRAACRRRRRCPARRPCPSWALLPGPRWATAQPGAAGSAGCLRPSGTGCRASCLAGLRAQAPVRPPGGCSTQTGGRLPQGRTAQLVGTADDKGVGGDRCLHCARTAPGQPR